MVQNSNGMKITKVRLYVCIQYNVYLFINYSDMITGAITFQLEAARMGSWKRTPGLFHYFMHSVLYCMWIHSVKAQMRYTARNSHVLWSLGNLPDPSRLEDEAVLQKIRHSSSYSCSPIRWEPSPLLLLRLILVLLPRTGVSYHSVGPEEGGSYSQSQIMDIGPGEREEETLPYHVLKIISFSPRLCSCSVGTMSSENAFP